MTASRWPPGSSAALCRFPRERTAPRSFRRGARCCFGQDRMAVVRQRGSHVRLKHPDRPVALVVPLHAELKRGTLVAILRDAGLDHDELRRLL